ncbi:MAG: hypothetical protein ACT4PT_02670 [Methanobacteriota archaeon]
MKQPLALACCLALSAFGGCLGDPNEPVAPSSASSGADEGPAPPSGNGTGGANGTEPQPSPGNATVPDRSPAGNGTDGPAEIARGHIALAGPWTDIRSIAVLSGDDAVDGVFFPAPAAGTVLATNATDGSGLGYDLSMNFHDEAGRWLGGCSSPEPEESCAVPEGAARAEVTAVRGVDVDVVVFALPA